MNLFRRLFIFTFFSCQNIFGQWMFDGPYGNIGGFPQSVPMDIAFVNDSTGVCSFTRNGPGSGGKWAHIFRTNNYGVTWTETFYWSNIGTSTSGGFLQRLSGDTIAYCFYGGFSNNFISYNGGNTWQFSFPENNPISTLFYHQSKRINYVSGFSNNTFKLARSGITNTIATIGGPAYSTRGLWMNSYKEGFIINQQKNLLTTIDSGFSWTNVLTSSFNLNSIYFYSANIGYIACDSGKILKTTNGGLNWVTQSTGYPNSLNSVSFKNDTLGYCVGNSGLILKTLNGGLSWKKENIGTTHNLMRVVTANKKVYVLADTDRVFSINLDTCFIRPNVTLTAPSSYMCYSSAGSATMQLTGLPSGGVYSGTNLTGNIFTTTNTVGINYFHYDYTDPLTGCVSTTNTSIQVIPNIFVSVTPSAYTACISSAFGNTISLTTYPASGGVLSGVGVSGYTFTPPNTPGTYSVTFSYTNTTNGCYGTATQNITVDACVGIAELNTEIENFNLYPNPTTGIINLNCHSQNLKISLFNYLGEELLTKAVCRDNNSINLTAFQAGIYFIRIYFKEDYSRTFKVVKE